MLSYLKARARNYLLKSLFCAVTEQDGLVVKLLNEKEGLGVVELNGKKVVDDEKKLLANEARIIQKSHLWSVIDQTMKAEAMKVMFEKSKTTDDLFFGKAMLYNISIVNKILSQLSKIEK